MKRMRTRAPSSLGGENSAPDDLVYEKKIPKREIGRAAKNGVAGVPFVRSNFKACTVENVSLLYYVIVCVLKMSGKPSNVENSKTVFVSEP